MEDILEECMKVLKGSRVSQSLACGTNLDGSVDYKKMIENCVIR
jgi:hypothetical protein